ncbi:MAG: PKD domain-containing protein [Bacteroidia bacterium]
MSFIFQLPKAISLSFILLGLSFSLLAQTPNFTVSPATSGCAPFVATFQPQATNAQSYSWYFGSLMGNSTVNSPTLTFTTAGTYNVTMVVTYTNGSKDTVIKNNYIQVYAPPVANFSASDSTICVGDCISFTSTSTSSPGCALSYTWDTGNGYYPNAGATIPNQCYALSSNYPVTLVVTDCHGCSDNEVKSGFIQVSQALDATFAFNAPASCQPPATVSFVGNAVAGATHSWVFGDGTFSPGYAASNTATHTYTNIGSYTVTHYIKSINGCISSFTYNNAVQLSQALPTITPASPQVCQDASITLQWSPVPNNTISWNFGATATPQTSTQNNPTVSFGNSGTVNVVATMTDITTGCQSQKTVVVTVMSKPNINFSANDPTNCTAPFSPAFTATVTGSPSVSSYSWNFGDAGTSTVQNPTHTYMNEGIYTVSLTAVGSNGCTTTLIKSSYITVQRPSADFSADTTGGCNNAPLSSDFSYLGTPVVSWAWSFPGANPVSSTVQNPQNITYTGSGGFNVTLIVTDADGCKDTLTKANFIKLGSLPIVNFTANPDSACSLAPISFINQSFPAGAGITALWKFDAPNNSPSSSGWNPTYTYSDTGAFSITLIVNNNGCKDSLTKTDFIHILPPVAKFTISPANNCDSLPTTVQVSNQTIGGDTYSWDFGDPASGALNTSSLPNPSHVYTTPGTYKIKVWATNNLTQCTDTISRIFRKLPIHADFLLNGTIACWQTGFTPIVTNLSVAATTFSWDFGNGFLTSGNPPSFSTPLPTPLYNAIGDYLITMTATNVAGCMKQDTQTVHIYGPVVNFSATNAQGCPPLITQFYDSTTSILPIVAYNWNFGAPGWASSSPNPTYTYNSVGTFDVTLVVYDAIGCGTVYTDTALVTTSLPTVSFGISPASAAAGCTGNPIQFYSSATGTGLFYVWNFGDGPSPPNNNDSVTHIYTTNGSYNVSLSVTDVNGCTVTNTLNNMVQIGNLTTNFIPSNTTDDCPPFLGYFTPQITAPFTAATYEWYFGDGGATITSTSAPPVTAQHLYVLPGNYTVTMITNSNGCKDTVTKTSLISIAGPIATYSLSDNEGCPGINVQFNITSSANVQDYMWYLYGQDSTSVQNPTYTYYNPGTYTPLLYVTDNNGCRVPIPISDTVIVHQPPTANFLADSLLICEGNTVNFTNTSAQGGGTLNVWAWNFGDATIGNGANPQHLYTTNGLMDVTMVVTDVNGCKDTLVKNDYIKVLDNVPPVAPEIQHVSVLSKTQVEIVFRKYDNLIEDFKQYVVYRQQGGNPPILVKNTTFINDTTFIDVVPDAEQESYCYWTHLVNLCESVSPPSTQHCTMQLSLTSLNDALKLDWSAYSGWNVKEYKIYRCSDYNQSQATYLTTVGGNVTSYTDFDMNCKDPVAYRIMAVKLNEETTLSLSDTALLAPQHNTNVTGVHTDLVTITNNKVVIRWKKPQIAQLQQISVLRAEFDQGYAVIAQLQPATQTEYVDATAQFRQKRYKYRVIFSDSCGGITSPGRMGTNILLRAEALGNSTTLSWTPYLDWDNGVKTYDVEVFDPSVQSFRSVGTTTDTIYTDQYIYGGLTNLCYRVKAKEQDGNNLASLSNEACVSVQPRIDVPNAFSPNGDGINDEFFVNVSMVVGFNMEIYDRWGVKVFETPIPSQKWDGTYRGKDVPEGVYTILIRYSASFGQNEIIKSQISLFR